VEVMMEMYMYLIEKHHVLHTVLFTKEKIPKNENLSKNQGQVNPQIMLCSVDHLLSVCPELKNDKTAQCLLYVTIVSGLFLNMLMDKKKNR
jgi:hypothetical protein